jgi:hypothetical protein
MVVCIAVYVGGACLDIERLYADIVGELERRADSERAEKEMYYHKKVGVGFKCYGISAPEFKEIAKKFSQTLKELGFRDRVELARSFSGLGMRPDEFWYCASEA